MTTNLVKHAPWGVDQYQQAKKEFDANSGDMHKLSPGRNQLRFLPALLAVPQPPPIIVTYNHFVEISSDSTVSFNCPMFMAKLQCRVCRRSGELKAGTSKIDTDLGYQLAAKLRVYTYIIDRANPEAGPRIFPFGKTIYDRLLTIRGDTTDGGDFTDPSEDGFDIAIVKAGEGKKTEYTVTPCRENTGLGHDEWLDDLKNLTPLTAFTSVPTDDEVLEKLGSYDLGGIGGSPGVGRGVGRGVGKRRNAMDDAKDT